MRKAKAQDALDDPVYQVAKIVRDAWSWLILREAIFYDARRFSEFQKNLGIARNPLAKSLERLTKGGLFERRTRKDNGTTLEYALTDKGRDFFICLVAAMRWSNDWLKREAPDDIRIIHNKCGKPFKAVLRCSHCKETLKARAVKVDSIRRATSDLIKEHRHRSPDLDLLERVRPSSIARTLKIFGDRWSTFVIRECFLGTRRFDDFLGKLGIASNILSNRLERLVAHGILAKRLYRPHRYEYRLTKRGLDLYPVPLASLTWAERWHTASRDGLPLRHKLCGKHFKAVLTCEQCSQPAGYSEMQFISKPRSDPGEKIDGRVDRNRLAATRHTCGPRSSNRSETSMRSKRP
jgi:DNA-binding HxlR family transcriptional regulator